MLHTIIPFIAATTIISSSSAVDSRYDVAGKSINITLPSSHFDVCKFDASICDLMSKMGGSDPLGEIVIGQYYPVSFMANQGKLQPGDVYGTISMYRERQRTRAGNNPVSKWEQLIDEHNRKIPSSMKLSPKLIDELNGFLSKLNLQISLTNVKIGQQQIIRRSSSCLSTISVIETMQGGAGQMVMITNFLNVRDRFFFVRSFVGSTSRSSFTEVARCNDQIIDNILKSN